ELLGLQGSHWVRDAPGLRVAVEEGDLPGPSPTSAARRVRFAVGDDEAVRAEVLEYDSSQPPRLVRGPGASDMEEDGDGYRLHEGVLQHGVQRRGRMFWRTVVPAHLRDPLVAEYHDLVHLGPRRTYLALRDRYYWPGMRAEVEQRVRGCVACKRRRGRSPPPPLQQYNELSRPFERVHVDLVGPLPTTGHGNRYILVAVDALTKWTELFAIPDKKARTVAEVIVEELLMRHGCFSSLITDRGAEFNNTLLRDVCALLRVRRISTTPYNPASDGAVERQNQEVGKMLHFLVDKCHRKWDDFLAVARFKLNTTPSMVTGYTPFYLMHGREARGPHDAQLEECAAASNVDAYAHGLAEALQDAWADGAARLWSAAHARAEAHQRGPARAFREHDVGDHVFVLKPFRAKLTDEQEVLSRKLAARWAGPYAVEEKLSSRRHHHFWAFPDSTDGLRHVPNFRSSDRRLPWDQAFPSDFETS
ncbi:MAG: integrase, partial [Pseudomonadota bacterium]